MSLKTRDATALLASVWVLACAEAAIVNAARTGIRNFIGASFTCGERSLQSFPRYRVKSVFALGNAPPHEQQRLREIFARAIELDDLRIEISELLFSDDT